MNKIRVLLFIAIQTAAIYGQQAPQKLKVFISVDMERISPTPESSARWGGAGRFRR
jgi:hypothetical protein